jgi:hypothetical protein
MKIWQPCLEIKITKHFDASMCLGSRMLLKQQMPCRQPLPSQDNFFPVFGKNRQYFIGFGLRSWTSRLTKTRPWWSTNLTSCRATNCQGKRAKLA